MKRELTSIAMSLFFLVQLGICQDTLTVVSGVKYPGELIGEYQGKIYFHSAKEPYPSFIPISMVSEIILESGHVVYSDGVLDSAYITIYTDFPGDPFLFGRRPTRTIEDSQQPIGVVYPSKPIYIFDIGILLLGVSGGIELLLNNREGPDDPTAPDYSKESEDFLDSMKSLSNVAYTSRIIGAILMLIDAGRTKKLSIDNGSNVNQ